MNTHFFKVQEVHKKTQKVINHLGMRKIKVSLIYHFTLIIMSIIKTVRWTSLYNDGNNVKKNGGKQSIDTSEKERKPIYTLI